MSNQLKVTPNDLSAFWMPFTSNRQFKQAPRMIVSAKDMHYTTTDDRKVLDGIGVGGIVTKRKMFAPWLTGVDHSPHRPLPAKNAFTRGEPEHGAELADELERIATLHDPSTIAAVIVEPVAGSTGVLIPPK